MKEGLGFSPSMILIIVLAFMGISFFMGSMIAGIGITVWMFGYGFYMNLL